MNTLSDEHPTIGVLGGTGAQGRGLALRWALSGLDVVIGSRDVERAKSVAAELSGLVSGTPVRGMDNRECAAVADVVVVAVPWDAHGPTLVQVREELAGKIVIDCVIPLGFDAQGPYVLQVLEGSAAQAAQSLLPDSRIVGAFHNVSAVLLADLSAESVDTDVLVLGEERDDVVVVQGLAERIPGIRGIHGGRLRNAGQIEALTANLIAINRRHKTHAGIRITGHGLEVD